MAKMIDLTGNRYGRLTVTGFAGMNTRGEATWNCICDCGGLKTTTGYLLRKNFTQSCGCLHAEMIYKTKKKFNLYYTKDDCIVVILSNTDDVMLCDANDWNEMKQHYWFKGNNGYAATNIKVDKKNVTMFFHQVIINCPNEMQRDHINRNRLDNRKCNLRIVDSKENILNRGLNKNNTSGYKGVYLCKRDSLWHAQIMNNRKAMSLGRFENIDDAITARLGAEIFYFGRIVSDVGGDC